MEYQLLFHVQAEERNEAHPWEPLDHDDPSQDDDEDASDAAFDAALEVERLRIQALKAREAC